MQKISRVGLGCMGMSLRNTEKSISTIHAAIDKGITLLNIGRKPATLAGNFYNGGESEIVLGQALKLFHAKNILSPSSSAPRKWINLSLLRKS